MNPINLSSTSFPPTVAVESEKVQLRGKIELPDMGDEDSFGSGFISQPPPLFALPRPEELHDHLKNWQTYFSHMHYSKIVQLEGYFQWLVLLPPPTDPYWQAIPNQELAACSDLLATISQQMENGVLRDGYKQSLEVRHSCALHFYFISMMNFSIIHQFMQRLYPAKLDGWGIPWDPTFINKVLQEEVFFDRGDHQAKLLALTKHMQTLSQNPRKGYLFGFDTEKYRTPLESQWFSHRWDRVSENEIRHLSHPEQYLKFLSQFIEGPPYSAEKFLELETTESFKPYRALASSASHLLRLSTTRRTLCGPSEYPTDPTIQKSGEEYVYVPACIAGIHYDTCINEYHSFLRAQDQTYPLYVSLFNMRLSDYKGENIDIGFAVEVNDLYSFEAPEKVLQSLTALRAPYNLHNRVALVLTWMQKNSVYLRNPAIQRYLFQLLLAGEHIQCAPPYVIQNVRLFIHQIISEFKDTSSRDRPHAAFWIHLGYLIESRLVLEGKEPSIHFYQQKTRELIQDPTLNAVAVARCKLLLIVLHAHTPTISFPQMEEFTKYLLQVNGLFCEEGSHAIKQEKSKLDLLRLEAGGIMLKWKDAHTPHFASLKILDWLEKQQIPGIPDGVRSQYTRQYPVYNIKGSPLDMIFGHYQGGIRKDREEWQGSFDQKIVKEALGLRDEETVEFDPKNQRIRTLDGSGRGCKVSILPSQPLHRLDRDLIPPEELEKFEEVRRAASDRLWRQGFLALPDTRDVITKKFMYKGIRGLYAHIEREFLSEGLPQPLYAHQIHWLSTEDKSNRHILIFDKKRIPYAKVIPLHGQEGKFECIKLNAEGEETDERLVQFDCLLHSATKSQLHQYLSEEQLKQGLIWAKPQNAAYVITSVEIPALFLTFEPKVTSKHVRLHSKQFPGYYLLGSEQKKACCLGDDAFLYEKSGGERLALIPCEDCEEGYFILTWNKKRKTFYASSPKENLLFISYLLRHGHFEQANQIIQTLQPLKYYDREDYDILVDISRHNTQEGGLVALQLALHFLDNRHQFFSVVNQQDEDIDRKALLRLIQTLIEKLIHQPVPFSSSLGLSMQQRALMDRYHFNHSGIPSIPKLTKNTVTKKFQVPEGMSWYPSPLIDLGQACYQQISQPRSPAEFALIQPVEYGKNLLATALYDNLTEGHAKNSQKTPVQFQLRVSLDELKTNLKQRLKQDEATVVKLTATIEGMANQDGSSSIGIHDQIYRSFLHRDPTLLRIANPLLSEEAIEKIWEEFLALMLIQNRVDQTREALVEFKKLATAAYPEIVHRKIAKILYKQRLYDPALFPQFLIYEYTTGLFLRPEQAELLKWIVENQGKNPQLMVEFQAGGGKTKVIAPILCLLAVQNNLMPTFFSLPAMYDVVKHDLKDALRNVFDIKTHVLEIDLDTELTEEKLKAILCSLKAWHAEGAAMVIKPIAYHKLHMQLYCNLDNPDSVAREILKFFKDHSLFLFDEAHRNLTSTWQAIVALDETPCLNSNEQQLFIQIYRLLTGVTPLQIEGKSLSQYVGLAHDNQAGLTSAQRKQVFRTIATWLCQHYFKIDAEKQAEMIEYLCQSKKEPPLFPDSWDQNQKELFFLARGLLTQALKIALKMMHEFDYGCPLHSYDVEMPRFLKMPTGAQFADPDLAAALTCQGLYQRGLDIRQFKEMVIALKKQHHREQFAQNTKEGRLFRQWQISAGICSPFFLRDIEHEEDIAFLHQRLKKRPEIIEYYLAHHLLAKVKRYSRQMNSTAADLNAGGYGSILFSATLGMGEEYPALNIQDNGEVKRTQLSDFPFQAAVIEEACAPRNATTHWLDPSDKPKVFFERLFDKSPRLFDELEGLIDAGGMHRHASTEQVARDFLQFNQEKKLGYAGALFIKEQAEGGAACQLILIRGGKLEYVDVHGSDFLSALRSQGFENPEKVRLFKILGPSQATGTDMVLSATAKMLLTVDSKNTLWDLIQAIMRCRGFLETISGTLGQSIVWVGSTSLREKLAAKYNLPPISITPKQIMQWCFEREFKAAEPRILLQAFQSIARVIRGGMEEMLETNQGWVRAHQKGIFFDEIARDLAMMYACSHTVKPIGEVLGQYTDALLAKAAIRVDEIPRAKEKIKAIILEAQKQIATVKTHTATHSTATVQAQQQQQQQQQMQQQKRQQQQQQVRKAVSPLPHMEYAKQELACHSPNLLLPPNQQTFFSANSLFSSTSGCSLFYEHLYLLGNVVKTNREKTVSLKPIDFVLVIVTHVNGINTPRFYCVSQEDAQEYATQLAAGAQQDGCYMALCTSLGSLAQNGLKNGLSQTLWEELTTHSLWKQTFHQIALLNAEIIDSNVFEQDQMRSWRGRNIPENALRRAFTEICDKQFFDHDNAHLLSFVEPSSGTEEIPNKLSFGQIGTVHMEEVSDQRAQIITPPPPSQREAPSRYDTTAWKVVRIVCSVLAILAFLGLGALGSISLIGGHWVYAPQFAVNLYKILPLGLTYASVIVSGVGVISLMAYAIFLRKVSELIHPTQSP
jgi:hypothetical protein